jgi:hypothetical protein
MASMDGTFRSVFGLIADGDIKSRPFAEPKRDPAMRDPATEALAVLYLLSVELQMVAATLGQHGAR